MAQLGNSHVKFWEVRSWEGAVDTPPKLLWSTTHPNMQQAIHAKPVLASSTIKSIPKCHNTRHYIIMLRSWLLVPAPNLNEATALQPVKIPFLYQQTTGWMSPLKQHQPPLPFSIWSAFPRRNRKMKRKKMARMVMKTWRKKRRMMTRKKKKVGGIRNDFYSRVWAFITAYGMRWLL